MAHVQSVECSVIHVLDPATDRSDGWVLHVYEDLKHGAIIVLAIARTRLDNHGAIIPSYLKSRLIIGLMKMFGKHGCMAWELRCLIISQEQECGCIN